MGYNALYGYRRADERKQCFLACGFVVLNNTPVSAGFEDVSVSGAGIITRKPLPLNAYVTLAFNTRKKGLLLVSGKVCWCRNIYRGWRSGVVFVRKLAFEPTMIA